MAEAWALGYRVQAALTTGEPVLHLIREGAEASLCGMPRTSLGSTHVTERVCAECIAWLPKRLAASAAYRRAKTG